MEGKITIYLARWAERWLVRSPVDCLGGWLAGLVNGWLDGRFVGWVGRWLADRTPPSVSIAISFTYLLYTTHVPGIYSPTPSSSQQATITPWIDIIGGGNRLLRVLCQGDCELPPVFTWWWWLRFGCNCGRVKVIAGWWQVILESLLPCVPWVCEKSPVCNVVNKRRYCNRKNMNRNKGNCKKPLGLYVTWNVLSTLFCMCMARLTYLWII